MKRFVLFASALVFAFSFTSSANACAMHGDKKATANHAAKSGETPACAMHASAKAEGHEHGAACPMKDKKVTERKDVTMTGKLLCMHCNLKKEETCRKVFQSADNTEKLYTICPSTKVDLEGLSEEGAATLTIKGELVKAEDGSEMLMIASAEKVKPAA